MSLIGRLAAILPRTSLLAGFLAFVACLTGCASSKPQASDYNALFAQRQYTQAYDAAAKVAGSRATNRDQASLIAGLSARSLDKNEDAKRWLTPLTGNADSAIAGRAAAGLGSIAFEEKRNSQALDLFTKAGQKLVGDDAAHALMCAGDSAALLGKPTESKALYTQAKAKLVSDQALRVEIGDRLAGVGVPVTTGRANAGAPKPNGSGKYTVQAGAFSTLKKAQLEAKRLASMGSTRTVPIKDHTGRTLYAVQVGRFASKADADRIRK